MTDRACPQRWRSGPFLLPLAITGRKIFSFLKITILLAAGFVYLEATAPSTQAETRTPSPAAPRINPDQARQLLGVLNDPKARQQFVATLTNLTEAQQATDQNRHVALVDMAMNNLSEIGADTLHHIHLFVQTLVNFRAFIPWARKVWDTPELQQEILRICWRVALMVAGGVALSYTMRLVLTKLRRRLEILAHNHEHTVIVKEVESLQADKATQRDTTLPRSTTDEAGDSGPAIPDDHARQEALLKTNLAEAQRDALYRRGTLVRLMVVFHRLPYTFGCFCLDIIGILMFPLVALLIQTFDPNPDERTLRAVWSITWLASVSLGVWLALLRAFLAPRHPWLRLSLLHESTAQFLAGWLGRIGIVTSWGVTALIIFRDCTLPHPVLSALTKLLTLSVHIMLAFMIVKGRSYVTAACDRSGKRNKRLASVLHIFSKTWWIIALFFDLALWLVWAADIRDGYQIVWRLFVRTCIAVLFVRIVSILLYGALERLFHSMNDWRLSQEAQSRILRYYPAIQRIFSVFLALLTIFSLALAWGAPVYSLIGQHSLGAELLSSLAAIMIALLIGVSIWEATNIAIEHKIRRLTKEKSQDDMVQAARIRTLQPMLRILLLVVLGAIICLTILSELGVNTAPLLAGASIFGVAIGFGSQKLVQDFISGIFLLLENALTVGDAVTLNGTYGIIERLSLRTVHVRANDGSMNIFPFSSLGQIINYNRDFARAIILVEVSYDADTDAAVQALYDITKGMREDPAYGPMIIDDLNIWGVDSLNDSSVTIKGTLPTTTAGRWPVQRQFNRRIKKTFQERGIGLPFPTRTLDILGFEKFLNSQGRQDNK